MLPKLFVEYTCISCELALSIFLFKTCPDKGGGVEGGYNQKILKGMSFMDGPLPKNLTIQTLKRKNFVTFYSPPALGKIFW